MIGPGARRAHGRWCALLWSASALAGCVSTEPRIELPYKMEANCENRAVKQTAIESIVASTDDVPQLDRYPGDAALRVVVHRSGGVFAYWHDQPVKLPRTARALGISQPYVPVVRVVITNARGTDSRPIWMTIRGPHGERIVRERAYDLQDVCIEGQRDI